MRNSCECCERYWTHLHGKVKCFTRQMNSSSRHTMVIPERFVKHFAWKITGTIKLEGHNGNVYDVGVMVHRNRTVLQSGWEEFVDANHIIENDSLMFRYRGSSCFKVVVFDSSGCEKVVSCSCIKDTISVQEPSTNSTDMSTSSRDCNTQLSASERSDRVLSHESLKNKNSDGPSEPPYILISRNRLSRSQQKLVEEKVQAIQSEVPIYVSIMKSTNIGPDQMEFRAQYAAAHLPHRKQTMVLQCMGKIWETKMLVRDGRRWHLSGGWSKFARDNHLRVGDICLFELKKNKRKLTMTVHIMSSCSRDCNTLSSASGRSDECQSGTSGHCRKRAKMDAITSPSQDLSGEDSPYEHESDDHKFPKPLYVLSGQCYVTEEQEAKIVALVQEFRPGTPLLAAVMKKPNVKPYPDLVIPKDYIFAYLPHTSQTITLQLPGQSKNWHCQFRVRSDGGRCNLYGCDFVRDNDLLEGDLCLFQPVTEGEGRTFMVMVHLLRKATADCPSNGSPVIGSNHGWASPKMASTVHVKEELADGEEISSEHEDHGTSKGPVEHDDSEVASEPPYIMSQYSHLTREQEKNVLEKIEAIQSELPIYVTVMNKTNVRRRGFLTFAKRYADAYLRKRSQSLVLQREGEGRTWHAEMQDKIGALRIFGGWTSFARGNHLQIGDICLFQLMENEGELKMMVYIIR